MRVTLIFCLVAFVFSSNLYSQQWFEYDPKAETQFAEAMQCIQKKDFTGAEKRFDVLRLSKKPHQRLTASYIMAAKAKFELKNYANASSVLSEFLQRFPQSSYHGDAYFVLGLTSVIQHQYDEAARKLLRAMEVSKDSAVFSKSADIFEVVAERHMSVEGLRSLYTLSHKPVVKDLLRLKLAEKLFAGGEPFRAKTILEDTVTQGYFSQYTQRIISMRRKIGDAGGLKIGAILPLMKSAEKNIIKQLAGEVLDGITFALDEYKKSMGLSALGITLDVRDTERDSVLAITELENLTRSPETIAVIGPLFSNTAFTCAPIANKARIPLISPTATSNGIAEIGPYVFQANPDFIARGKAMAQFTHRQLGLSRVAVLTPKEGVGKQVADSFVEEAIKLGLDVVGSESYTSVSDDLRDQFMNLRYAAVSGNPKLLFTEQYSETEIAAMIQAGANGRLVDSLRVTGGSVWAKELFGERGKTIADSLRLRMMPPEINPESIDTPMTLIQGIFIPVNSAAEIGSIAPQMSFYNIKAQILGSNEWYELPQLDAHRQYVNGAMFISDSYISPDDTRYKSFDDKFFAEFKKHPTKYSLYGYDTMNLLIDRIHHGALNREVLAEQLAKVEGFAGIHSLMTFSNRRVNSDMHILRYFNGVITQIGEVSGK